MAIVVLKIKNSKEKRLVSKKKEIWLAIMMAFSVTSLILYNRWLNNDLYNSKIVVLLIAEDIIAAILLILTLLPFCGIDPHQNYQPVRSFQRLPENTDSEIQNIVLDRQAVGETSVLFRQEIDEDPPKYEDLFPDSY